MGIGIWIAAICINIPVGYGVANLIMAILIERSNVFGDSRSKSERISSPISYVAKTDNVAMDTFGFGDFCDGYVRKMKNAPEHREIKTRSLPKESLKLVERRFEDESSD